MRRTKFNGKSGPKCKCTIGIIKEAQELVGLLGLTHKHLAEYFKISEKTIENWVRNKPAFEKALRIGRIHYGLKVAKATNMLATGFTIPDEKIFCNGEGHVTRVPYMKYYPPNAMAAIKWLAIMFRDIWAETSTNNLNINHSGTINHKTVEEIPINELTKEQQEFLFQINMKQLKDVRSN